VSAAENPRPRHRTLSDVYAERALTAAQVRRIVAILRLTEGPTRRSQETRQDAA
jgi:hypothetical protein